MSQAIVPHGLKTPHTITIASIVLCSDTQTLAGVHRSHHRSLGTNNMVNCSPRESSSADIGYSAEGGKHMPPDFGLQLRQGSIMTAPRCRDRCRHADVHCTAMFGNYKHPRKSRLQRGRRVVIANRTRSVTRQLSWGCRQHINGAPSKPRPSRWSRSSPGSWRGLIPPRGGRHIVMLLNHIVEITLRKTACRHVWTKGAMPRRSTGRNTSRPFSPWL